MRRLLAAVLVLAAIGFIVRRMIRDVGQLRTFDWTVRPGQLAVSVVFCSLVLLWGVLVWQYLLRKCGLRVPFRPLARAWFLSNLGKYIPGVVWQFVSLAQLGPSVGLTPAVTVMSLLVQMGFQLLSAGVLGVWLLPVEVAGKLGPFLPALRLLTPLALVAIHPRVIAGTLGLVGRVSKREMPRWEGSWLDGLAVFLLSAVSWVLAGAAFFVFLTSFVDLPASTLGPVIGMNALAFIVAYVVVIAPAGIGFKEAALALLLAGYVPPGVAAALALAARPWSIVCEALPALLLLARGRGSLERQSHTETERH